MPDNEQIKSKKDLALERIRSRYPDKNFDDEELFFGQINDDYDGYDNEIAGYKERESKFSNMFTADPRSARLMMDWKEGQDPAVTLVRLYGTDIKDAIDDPEKQEAIAEANKEYMDRVTQETEYEEEYSKNLEASIGNIELLQQEQGISDDDVDNAMAWLIGIIKDGVMGKFSPETIAMALKAQNYDAAVEQAVQEGEVKGRNTKIEEKLRKEKKGDGTATLDGKSGKSKKADPMPSLGALDNYGGGNQNIFERGGEKRTPYKR